MKRIIVCGLFLLSVLGVAAEAAEPEEDNDTVATPAARKKNTILLTYGTYRLFTQSQNWQVAGGLTCKNILIIFSSCSQSTSPLANEFDTRSREVYGAEYEREYKDGFSYGAILFQARNSFTVPAISASPLVSTAHMAFATITKYFGEPGGFQPFFGIGAGGMQSQVGDGTKIQGATGGGFLVKAGLRYESGRASIFAGFRATHISGNLTTDATKPTFGTMKAGGRGFYAGAGINF